MCRSEEEPVDCIVWVGPQKYYEYEYSRKPGAARLISHINQRFESTDRKPMLLVPDHVETSSPELDVPIVHAETSQFSAICEMTYEKASYHPDLSYDNRTFQDVVEADAYYGAISDNSKTKLYRPKLLARYPEMLKDILPGESQELVDIIKVHDVNRSEATLTLDA